MAYSRDAFTRDQQETRERQDQRETREKLERYGAMEDGLSQSNKIAGENQRQQEERARESYRYLEIARDIWRQLEIARDGQRQLEKARDSQRELERRYGAIQTTCTLTDKQTDKRTDITSS